jgi:hypothetical protein
MSSEIDIHSIHSRERLAWAVFLVSFGLCLIIGVSTPIVVNAFLQNATDPLVATVQANRGTVGITASSGARSAVLAGDAGEVVQPGVTILTDATASALLLIGTQTSEETLLARVRIDNNTLMELRTAAQPRFAWSDATQEIWLDLDNGRLRLTLLDNLTRPVRLLITTPQGTVTIREPGQYSLEVDNLETQVTVQSGSAALEAQAQTLILLPRQRATIINEHSPSGPLTPERNLIQNGNFNNLFTNWSEFTWKVELADQPTGRTTIEGVGGESILRFARGGMGHADVRVRQSLNHTVSGYTSLRVLLSFRILDQSLGVCGIQGSECPLFIRINYVDENGVNQIWQHGFYAVGEIDDNTTPGACVSCAVIQDRHEQVPLGQDYFYEVDLFEELARQGTPPPRQIESISLVASGHSFVTEILEVALMAEE